MSLNDNFLWAGRATTTATASTSASTLASGATDTLCKNNFANGSLLSDEITSARIRTQKQKIHPNRLSYEQTVMTVCIPFTPFPRHSPSPCPSLPSSLCSLLFPVPFALATLVSARSGLVPNGALSNEWGRMPTECC